MSLLFAAETARKEHSISMNTQAVPLSDFFSVTGAGDPGGVSVIVFASGNSSSWGSMVQSRRLVAVVSDVIIAVKVLTVWSPPGGKGKF